MKVSQIIAQHPNKDTARMAIAETNTLRLHDNKERIVKINIMDSKVVRQNLQYVQCLFF